MPKCITCSTLNEAKTIFGTVLIFKCEKCGRKFCPRCESGGSTRCPGCGSSDTNAAR